MSYRKFLSTKLFVFVIYYFISIYFVVFISLIKLLAIMTFRTKTKNKLLVEERQTLDAKHNGILSLFNENKDRLPELELHLKDLEKTLTNLKDLNANKIVIDMDLQKKIWKLDDERTELLKNIENIRNNIEENKYMLNTGKIISNYYKIIEQEKEFASTCNEHNDNITAKNNSFFPIVNNNSSNINEFIPNKKKNIMDWFSKSDNNTIPFENIDTNSPFRANTAIGDTSSPFRANTAIGDTSKKTLKIVKKNVQTTTTTSKNTKDNESYLSNKNESINDNNTSTSSSTSSSFNNPNPIKLLNKDEIYEKYMKVYDKNYISINNDDVPIFDKCSLCYVEMLLNNNTGILICPNCGATENIIIDSDKPSFKEPPKEMTSFCYKRINHLNEFLAQFQAKETTDIPEDVYNEILVEIKKERITNMAHITPEKMRIILKKIKKNDYYEHIPYIINQLNGLPAPVIAPEIEEIIRGMFKGIQIPFEKYCPHKRKNFLSYNYVMYKFFELLELDEYLDCFQLLKSRTKLHQQDLIWKNICLDLNWQFIKSL